MDRPKSAKDIMATKLVTLPPKMHVYEGIRNLLRHRISGAPVVDDQRNYLGVFSEKCCMSVLTIIARLVRDRQLDVGRQRRAKDFMVTKLVTLSPRMDAIKAIGELLKHQISGAPVLDESGRFLGVFSEKTSIQVMVECAYAQLPAAELGPFMNTDRGRTISEDLDLLDVAQMFLDTPYRRLPVLRDDQLVGQISRRDVLREENDLSRLVEDRDARVLDLSEEVEISDESRSEHRRLPTPEVGSFMDAKAHTITEDLDLLSVAQVFLSADYRRLPVLRDGKLVGQVSRRDVLRATHKLMKIPPVRENPLLYLSALVERNDAPFHASTPSGLRKPGAGLAV